MTYTIKTRLLAGCGVLVLVLAVACLLGWKQAASSEKSIGSIIHQNRNDLDRLAAVEDATLASAKARFAERDFLLRKNLGLAHSVSNELSHIEQLLATGANSADAKRNQNALGLAENYAAAFNALTELCVKRGLTPDQGLEGRLRQAAHAIESTVTALNVPELNLILLQCRRHEKDYLLRGTTNYLGDIGTRIDEFTARAKALAIPAAEQARITDHFDAYFNSMRELAATDQSIKTATADCQQAAGLFQQEMEALSTATKEAIAGSQKDALNLMASGKLFMLVLLGIGVALAGFVAWGLSRSITTPILAAVEAISLSAEQTSAASTQVSSASQSLAQGASEQAASLEETGASLEEMASMTRRNAGHADSAKLLANQTRASADAGAANMAEMSVAMDAIKASSDNIAKIIKTIDEIAFQTNILALNAAVEAARAGEAGMGFAVVADEVRNLAQRSAAAARETTEKIAGSIRQSEHGVQISLKVASSLEDIVARARQVDDLVAEIAAASKEQSNGINEINTAVGQLDKITQSNAATAEESASAAEELNAQATALKEAVQELSQLAGRTAGRAAASTPRSESDFLFEHPAQAGQRRSPQLNGGNPAVVE